MPHNVAFDLGLHCLPMSHKKNSRLIWVKRQLNLFVLKVRFQLNLFVSQKHFNSKVKSLN